MYTVEDAKRCIELFTTVEYGKWFSIDDEIKVLFTDAGHIIGSAAVSLQILEDEQTTHITFSGDVGRYNDALLKAPEEFPQADYILLESTYGNKLHQNVNDTSDAFLSWIKRLASRKKVN